MEKIWDGKIARRSIDGRPAEEPGNVQLVHYCNEDGSDLPVLEFPLLQRTGIVRHFFTTRLGGVSEGIYSSMNLSWTRGDDPERVKTNFGRAARALGIQPKDIVLTYQVHGTKVIRVGREDAGKGVTRKRDWNDVDGLVTNEPGLALGTFFADCVPIMFVDPVHRAIGSCHSGWRGTAAGIGRAVLEKMHAEFGTDPGDVLCVVGPSICQQHYEVSEDVAGVFRDQYKGRESLVLTPEENGHSLLNLWQACRLTLLDAGVLPEHISVTDICTACNPELLFSHRVSKGQHGNFAGFIVLLPKN
jgi:YfiH family protein